MHLHLNESRHDMSLNVSVKQVPVHTFSTPKLALLLQIFSVSQSSHGRISCVDPQNGFGTTL